MHQTLHQPASGESRTTIYEHVTSRLVSEMEQGRFPWVKPWDSGGAALGLPRSAATRKTYSGINILILWDAVMTRAFASQEWLTLRQCNELGGHVRKGERGTTACYADSFIPKAERDRACREGENPNKVPFLKRFTLFNIEQCEGLPAHIVAPPTPHPTDDLWTRGDALAAATGAVIREGGGEAFYHQGEDFIRIPPAAAFVSAADYFCTLYHELGHWTAHPTRLNRDLKHRFGSTAYAREELIAELTSAFVCAQMNIVPQVRHADYLAHWLDILKQDSRAIFHAASQASKAAEFLFAFQNETNPASA